MNKKFCQSKLAAKSLLMVIVILCLCFSTLSPINAYSKAQEEMRSYTISVDGVHAILTSPINTQSEFYFPQPYDIVQNSYSVDFEPVYKEISLLAIPYGITPRTENLPVSSTNSESNYREALQSFRNSQGGNPKGGITANIFGNQVLGIYSIVQLNVSGATPVPVIIGEWVEELSSRIWILRISSELPSSYKQADVDFALQSLQNTILSSENTDTPSTSRFPTSQISGQTENESIVSPDSPMYSDLPTPSWWNGDCDTNYFYSQTGVNSYRLGAVYRNMPACGPKGYLVPRNFGVGVSQLEFQCPELSKRFLYLAYGIAPYSANGSEVVWNYTGTLLQKITNGTPGKAPQLNDVLSYGPTTTAGHTSVVASSSVDSSGYGWITVIEENLSDSGWQALQVSNWTVIGNVAAVSGWLHDPSQDSVCPGPTLNSPSNDFVSSSQTITFSWTGPSGCTYSGYTFRVKDTPDMEAGGTTIIDEGQGGTSVTKTFDTQWNYKDLYWGVRTANPLSPNWSVRHFRIEPSSSSCSPSSNQVSLFVNANYGGECITKNIGEYSNPSSIGLPNDAISSLKVGSDVQAILCKDDNYLGGCETFTSDDADLSNNSIGDNQVSSLKVVSDVSLEHPIQLYKDADYITGYCYIDSAGWFNLDGVCESYNDQISSFKLQTGWSVRFYKEFGLIGSNQCFTVADSNLSDNTYTDGTGMNDTISSVALYNQSTCPPLVVPPSAPTLSSPANNAVLERTVNLTLSWNSVSGASEYYAEFWGGPSLSVNSGWTTNTSWFLGSQWGGVYQWRVKARNSAGESGWSETRTLTIKYGSPTNLTATAVSTSQINLSWGASVDAPGNIDGYRIYRNGSSIATTTSSTTTYNNTGLNPGTTYSYYVIAYKGTLESDPSNTASATTNSLTCYTLTVSVSPTSSGSVTLNPTPNCNGTQYISGTVVQLTAIPATNYRFVSWSGDISGTSNPTSVTMNGSRNVIANFASTVISDRRIFLPLTINYSGSTVAGIQGRVLLSGAPIGGMQLELLSYDGSTSISILTTTTLSDGTYLFTGVPSLTTGKYYYVRYINSADPSKVYYWATPLLSSYTAGSGFRYGDFDIANVFYTSPVPSATVPLPTTFTWNRRASTTTDSYEFNLLAWDAWNYLFWTDPIGYVGSYTLNSMPAGMYINTPYGWEIWIYSPDGGIGIAYYVRQITFSSTGTNQSMLSIPSRDLDRIPSLDILVLRRLEKIER